MKKFFSEFKEFISRGNVMDLAIGVIIGGAFSAIITALTNNILMPIINWVLLQLTGGEGLNEVFTFLDKRFVLDEAGNTTNVIDLANSIYIDWGAFITAIINFILIALVLFLIIKTVMRLKGIGKNKYGETITRDEYKKMIREGKTKEEIAKIDSERVAQKKAEEEAKAAEAAANTTEALLKDIRDLLKNQK